MPPIERAARALCATANLPEDTKYGGQPMWASFVEEAHVVLDAVEHEHLRTIVQRIIDWDEVGQRGPDWAALAKLKADAAAALR